MALGGVHCHRLGIVRRALYFFVLRTSAPAIAGLTARRAQTQRIKELQAQDISPRQGASSFAARDIYFQQGKLEKAEASYRAALERDPQVVDTRAHWPMPLAPETRR